jgi:uncharacterized coiled-coil protein SlyX
MLKISATLALPPDAITQRAALLAVSGAGKSNAARAMAEEFFAARLPFVAVDPKGDWWGLRAGRDGKAQGGLDVVIFGGEHGDIPLERGAGALVADTIVDQRLSCVLDLSGFESEAARKAFLLDFATRLYQRNRDPLHLFLEEADDYLPQKPMRDEARLLRAFENIVRRGRSKGLGMTLITQRSAVVNKNVLTQVETLFALRTTGPQDIAAIEAWMKYHGADREMLSTLAGLEDGEAWVWSPHYLKKTQRFRFRRSHTFDSGATPTNHAAGSRRAPATLADVDLAALKERMAATLERVAAEDPKALRKRIAELERQLASQKPTVERVEVPTVTPEDRAAIDRIAGVLAQLSGTVEGLRGELERIGARVKAPAADGQLRVATAYGPITLVPKKAPRAAATSSDGAGLGKCARALLAALIQHGNLSLQQAAIIGMYSPSSSVVRNSAGELRSLDLVSGTNALLSVTAAGRARPEVAGLEVLPVGPELAKVWLERLGKCEAALLRQVLRSHPRPISLEQAAIATGEYSPTSSVVRNSAGRLRTLMLVDGGNAAMTANERLVS